MSLSHASKFTILALAGTVALAACRKDEPAPATDPAAVPMASTPTTPANDGAMGGSAPMGQAVSVQSITIGSAAAEDGSVSAQGVVASRDPIIVSIRTDGAASGVPVTARLTYQDGQVAGEESVTLDTSGPEVTNITFRNSNPWPAGRYNIHVTVDGRTVGLAQQVEVR